MIRCLLALLVLLGGLLVGSSSSSVSAQPARQASVDRLDLLIDVLADGTLQVTQTEQSRYTGTYQRDGRDIPFRGISSLTEVHLAEPGRPYRQGYNEPFSFSAARVGDAVRVDWWFPAVSDAVRTTILSYRVSGALRPSAEAAELNWLAIPGDRGAGIEAANVVLRMPPTDGPEALEAQAWIGDREIPAEAADRRELRFAAGSLGPDESLTVQARVPGGLVAVPASPLQVIHDLRAAYPDTIRPVIESLLLLLGGLVLAVGLLGVARGWPGGRRGRLPQEVGGSPYQPPSQRPPALAGLLADERLDGREAAATLLDLVGRGLVCTETGLVGAETRLVRHGRPLLGLEAYEQTLLAALFPDPESTLAAGAERWRQQQSLFADQVRSAAAQHGLWVENRAEQVNRTRLAAVLGAFACAALALLSYGLFDPLLSYSWVPFAAGGLVCLAVLATAARRSPLTPLGRQESAGWNAYASVLADRPAQASPEQRFRQLAYGVALGLEDDTLARVGAAAVPTEATSLARPSESGPMPAIDESDPVELARTARRAFGGSAGPG